MPGILSNVFETDGSTDQPTVDNGDMAQEDTQTFDAPSDDTADNGLVPVDIPELQPFENDDAPNAGAM